MRLLSNLATISSGVYAKTEISGATILLQPADLLHGKGLPLEKTANKVSLRAHQKKHLLSPDDLLLIAKGKVHTCFLFRKLNTPAVASTAFYVIRLRSQISVLPEYLCWYLNTPGAQAKLTVLAKGTSIPSISIDDILSFEVPVPALTSQKAIVQLAALHQRKTEIEAAIAHQSDFIFQHQLLNLAKQSA